MSVTAKFVFVTSFLKLDSALPETYVGNTITGIAFSDFTKSTMRLPGRPTKRDRRDLEDFLDWQANDDLP